MKIIFFGSSNFALPSLRALISNKQDICCVVTQPDRKKGRGMHIEGTAVKSVAQSAGLSIYQPEDVNSPESVKYLRKLNADLFIIISYGQILSQQLLDIPKIFPINAHASLLPKYRGAAPMNWTLINGERSTGVTIIKVIKKMDAGPVIMQKEIDTQDDETVVSLEEKLSKLASEAVIESAKMIKENKYRLWQQDEERVTLAPKLKKSDGLINWERPAAEISNLIKGCVVWPGAFTHYRGKLLKIYRAAVFQLPAKANPGEIARADKHGITVACGKDCLVIQELQIEGKRKMSVDEFIAGHRICAGEIFK